MRVKCPSCSATVQFPSTITADDPLSGFDDFVAGDKSSSIPPPIVSPSPKKLSPSFSGQERPGEFDIIVSSGAICADYTVLGMVIGFASKSEGCGGDIPVESVYTAALQRLTESARARYANGLIYVNFQNRVASTAGCGNAKQVFEVFAWGTAVRF